jgi:hypothetical protein
MVDKKETQRAYSLLRFAEPVVGGNRRGVRARRGRTLAGPQSPAK